jgi:hypothetical protein
LEPGGPDECQVAADIYQCGRDVAPTVTDEIFTRSKGNATMVGLFTGFYELIHTSLLISYSICANYA